jgi:hypothetical protein
VSDNPKVKRVCITIEFEGMEPQHVELTGEDLNLCMIQKREIAALYREGAIDVSDFVPTGYLGLGLMVSGNNPEEHKKFLEESGERVIKPGARLAWPIDWS